MATITIKHAALTGAAANPAVLVDGPKWDATHTITGIENVDNTSDLNKPISTATQTALDAKITGTAAALTKTDDTNVTATLGGTPATALLQATSITLGWAGTLAATRGGTGTGSYAVGDLLYASTTSALSKLAGVATGNALISGGVNTAPSWGKIGLSTHISGFGTGVATALGVNVGSAGAPVVLNGALGTPSSGTLTSCTAFTLTTTGTSGAATYSAGTLNIPNYSGGSITGGTYPLSSSGANIIYVGPTNSGQLTYNSTTQLNFVPYNGDTIRIGGTVFQIPAAGIAGLGAPTSVFLNGVAAQTLAINTTYYIYAFSNSGTVTADFSTTGHVQGSTAGNIGTEIKSGDNTRTLIGMVRTGGTVIYASDIQTASWFNRRNKTATQAQSLAAAGNSVAINFVTWAEEALTIGTAGFISNTGTNISVWQDRIDASNVGIASQGTISSASAQMTFNSMKFQTLSEGNHAYDSALSATGGTPSAAGTSSIMIRG